MKKNDLPSVEFLTQCFDVVDGALFWKARPREHFKSDRSMNMWIAKFAGKRAGRTMVCGEYRQVGVSGIRYLEHRILAVIYGMDTFNVIDHIDGNGLNNRIENLRPATQQENARNSHGKGNKALRVGINKKGSKFTASIRIGNLQKWLGSFDTESEAIAARKGAENLFFAEFAVNENRVLEKAQKVDCRIGNDQG
jgi:hypothetical protein